MMTTFPVVFKELMRQKEFKSDPPGPVRQDGHYVHAFVKVLINSIIQGLPKHLT